jgi:hypothetical protein
VKIQIVVFWIISEEYSVSVVRAEGSKFKKAINYTEGKINETMRLGLEIRGTNEGGNDDGGPRP